LALSTEGDNAYESKRVPFEGNDDLQPILYIEDESVNSTYIDYQNKFVNQTGNASISHIKDRIVMSGEASIDGNVANVEFSHLLTIFKINLTFPDELIGQTVGKIDLYDYNTPFSCEGWGYIDGYAFACGGEENTSELYLGGWNDTEPNGITIPEGEPLTVYVPTFITKGIEAGSSWAVRVYDSSLDPIADNSLTWNEDKILDPGKMYTFDVSVRMGE